jgi:hypothetical protein
MAIAWVSTGAMAAAAATSVAVVLPSHSTNDLIIVFGGGREDSTADALDISGYTAIGTQAFLDIGTSAITLHAWYKFATSGAESNPTITGAGSAAGGCFGFAVVYSGVDQTTPLSGVTVLQGTNAAADQFTPPQITPDSASERMVISAVATSDNNALAIVTSQSFTTRASGASYETTTGLDLSFAQTEKAVTQATAVTLPTYDITALGTDEWAYKTFVLRPDANATFSTLVGDAPAAGGSTTFTGAATFSTNVGDAPAAGGSTTFTPSVTFNTTVGDAPAAGGSSTFTGNATFDTTVGNAPAAGGSTTLTGGATFSTTVGDALAAGGVTTFDATGGATTQVIGVRYSVSGGLRTGYELAVTATSAQLRKVIAGSVTNLGSPVTVTRDAGTVMRVQIVGSSLSGTVGDTTVGPVTDTSITSGSPGLYNASTGIAVDDFEAGEFATSITGGGSTTFTGGATFATTVGDAAAAGGVSTFDTESDATFSTTVGDASAAGGSSTFTGSATFATSATDAAAAGSSSTFTGSATFDTTVGDAPGSGGSSAFTGGAEFVTVVGDAIAAGGVSTFDTESDGTFATLAGDAIAAGGSTTFVAADETVTVGGPFHDPRMRQPRPRPQQQTVNATFASIVGELVASGGVSIFTGTTAAPLTVAGHNANVLELI